MAWPVQAATTGFRNDSRCDNENPALACRSTPGRRRNGTPSSQATAEHPIVAGDDDCLGSFALGAVQGTVDLTDHGGI